MVKFYELNGFLFHFCSKILLLNVRNFHKKGIILKKHCTIVPWRDSTRNGRSPQTVKP